VVQHAAALLVGGPSGLLGSFVHPLRVVGVPAGLGCGLALTGAAVAAGGLVTRSRTGAAAAAVGWVVPVLLLSAPLPEGDLVVQGTALGDLWLLGVSLVVGSSVACPYAGAGRPSSAEGLGGR
jgi:hypothetical protein